MSEYRILVTHRYSSRWANRFNRVTSGPRVATFVWPDELILCDLCNKSYPEASDTEILILQHRWGPTEPWSDGSTRCPDCQEGLENLPRLEEDRIVTCPQCKKEYTPDLPERRKDAEPYQNEQHQIGYCSDKCNDEALSGTREPQYTYDERGRRFENGVRKLFADPPED